MTITGVELILEILLNADSRVSDELAVGRQAYITVEPSGEADPHSFAYWFTATCGGEGRVDLWSDRDWTPGRQGRCRIEAEARILADGRRPFGYGSREGQVYATATKTVNVGAGALPDLRVSVSLSQIMRTDWGEEYFTLTATVRNVGRGRSEQTPLYIYQSATPAVRTTAEKYSPDRVTREWLDEIPKGGRLTLPIFMPAPGDGPGQREGLYFSACVAAVHGESNTANNCSGRGVQPQG